MSKLTGINLVNLEQ